MDIFKQLMRVWLDLHLLPGWMQDRTPNINHPYRRRFTPRHQRKKNIVRNVWIIAALLVLLHPMLHTLLIIALPATLLSFAILDETR